MTQGILLVGGKGTRLAPLTQTVPKPMLPVAGLPVTEHQLVSAKEAGIDTIVLAASYLADVFLPYFGDGREWGIQLKYAIEAEPLGTGGAILNAAQLLKGDEPIVIFNGDVLSSHNLTEQIRQHVHNDADITLLLTRVEDARAYGCVPIDEDGRVLAFLEKMENPVANTINAGCYIFHPRVLADIPSQKVVSIEREIFPEFISRGRKVFGYIDGSYWLDIGTPQNLLQGSIDLVEGTASAPALGRIHAERHGGHFVSMKGSQIATTAKIGGGSAIGKRAHVGEKALILGSIVSEDAVVGAGATLRRCFVAHGATVPAQGALENSYIGVDGVIPLIARNAV